MVANIKLYRGKKRLGKRMNRESSSYTQLLRWALTIKVGDYIGTCEGCNRKVAEIEQDWENEGWYNRCKSNKTWFLREVGFTDTHGRLHFCPGGGCAFPAETAQQVTDYFTERNTYYLTSAGQEQLRHWNPKAFDQAMERVLKMDRAIKAGLPIVDEFGEILPEFDKDHNPYAAGNSNEVS